MALALHAIADHHAVEYAERGEQGDGAAPLVIIPKPLPSIACPTELQILRIPLSIVPTIVRADMLEPLYSRPIEREVLIRFIAFTIASVSVSITFEDENDVGGFGSIGRKFAMITSTSSQNGQIRALRAVRTLKKTAGTLPGKHQVGKRRECWKILAKGQKNPRHRTPLFGNIGSIGFYGDRPLWRPGQQRVYPNAGLGSRIRIIASDLVERQDRRPCGN